MYQRYIKAFLFLLAALVLSGCFEAVHDYTINPDGSGKVEFNVRYIFYDWLDRDEKIPEEIVRKIKSESIGVDAWKDLNYKVIDKNSAVLSGTAYFKDINQLAFPKHGLSSWMKIIYENEGNGQGRLKLVNSEPGEPLVQDLKEEEITQRIQEERSTYYSNLKPILDQTFGQIMMDISLSLPGQVSESVNFQKTNSNKVKIVFSGKKVVEVAEVFTDDDNWWREQITSGRQVLREGPNMNLKMNEQLFGQKAPIGARLSEISSPLFDYEKEASLYRVIDVPLEKFVEQPSAVGDALNGLRVGGQKIVYFLDKGQEISPFGEEPGYTLWVVGNLIHCPFSINGGRILSVLTDTGQSLLPEEVNKQQLNNIELSLDKTQVSFEFKFDLPGPEVKKIKEIKGELYSFSGSDLQKIDLGLPAFEPGLSGNMFNARVESIIPNSFLQGYETISLRVNLPADAIMETIFLDESGRPLQAEESAIVPDGDETLLHYSVQGRFPLRGRVIMKAYQSIKKFSIPFHLQDIEIPARP